ncbi:MAG: calcium-binding protein, partial [Phenylobacterium sp.]|nr:calcium-binding protein [Phenylobacterium sp.]
SLAGKVATGGRLDIDALMSGGATAGAGVDIGGGGGGGGAGAGVTITGTSRSDHISTTTSVAGQPRATGHADTLSGMGGADTLRGGAGDDSLLGGGGADKLYGDEGADTMAGGDRNDTYYADSADRIIEAADAGNDRVYSDESFTLPANVERLYLTGEDRVNGVGNGLDNVLNGNAADNRLRGLDGDDTLSGGGGDDILEGGDGADSLRGGPGEDRFVFVRGEARGDRVEDFSRGDLLEFRGYAPNSTFKPVAGSDDEWRVTDGQTGLSEIITFTKAYALGAGDFLFT